MILNRSRSQVATRFLHVCVQHHIAFLHFKANTQGLETKVSIILKIRMWQHGFKKIEVKS